MGSTELTTLLIDKKNLFAQLFMYDVWEVPYDFTN
jgi:hypothetical protein